jgi:hypothetical protein
VRPALVAAALLLAACASRGGLPARPYADIPVPPRWTPYSREWMMIQTPQVTTAKFVYFSEAKVGATLDEARQLFRQSGWQETRSERFVNPEKFPGVWADFAKGEDRCRVTVIEGAHATHVDYAVARVTRPQ